MGKAKEQTDPVMDINRYLSKNPKEKNIGDMLEILFRGELLKEAEWDAKVGKILNKKVF